MTTTRCLDCNVTLSSRNRTAALTSPDVCDDCFDYAGHENMHNDDGHDSDNFDAACRVCTDDAPKWHEPKQGHTDTAARSWSSHAGHDHPATAKARAACRKARNS